MGMRGTFEAWGWLNPKPAAVNRSAWGADPFGVFTFNGNTYPYGMSFTQSGQPVEDVAASFAGYCAAAYRSSGLIFALMTARASLFSEARFQWRQMRDGRPGPLFGTQALAPLEKPWTNAKTGDLLVRLMQDYDLTGNFFGWRNGADILRMRPDWVTIVLGSQMQVEHAEQAIDAKPIGYVYHPGGAAGNEDPILLDVADVCHFTGLQPDPMHRYLGCSWLSSIIAELQADKAMTAHKQSFFEHAATPNMAIILDVSDPDRFSKWQEKIASNYGGVENSYKTMILGAGASIVPVGTDMQQLDFKVTQGAGETRIAAAAGVPPVIVGFSEGLEAATYSNYGMAMERFARLTISPLWRAAAACFESILEVPPGAELWYDDRDIPALQDNITDKAEVQVKQMAAAKQAVDAGYEPDSVVDYLNSNDISRLVHSGLATVQLQPMGEQPEPVESNGDQPALPPGERTAVDELIHELERRA